MCAWRLRWATVTATVALSSLGAQTQAQVPQVGNPAPDFTLEESRGGEVSLSDFQSKVVFINFFGFN